MSSELFFCTRACHRVVSYRSCCFYLPIYRCITTLNLRLICRCRYGCLNVTCRLRTLNRLKYHQPHNQLLLNPHIDHLNQPNLLKQPSLLTPMGSSCTTGNCSPDTRWQNSGARLQTGHYSCAANPALQPCSLDNPDNIVIHTGTNDLRSKREGVSEAVREMAEKAHRVFPEANIVISTLLPRTDFPQHMINKINKKITKDCAPMTNINIAHHPAITHEHLYDGLHLDQDSVRIFAKSIKDTALSRSPLTHHHSQGPLDTCHPITETSAEPRMTQPNSAYARMTQPSGAQPSAARTSPAQSDPAQRSPAQRSPAQRSPTQDDPAQCSPTQPNYCN
ncbi:hypothetical protein SKAU_G00275910 [Synaphobranchus kaupii]|uniref:Uncharacterized protein n=1 Tax=Synaphobranchus kaupii TaxID=118154 RepID=A0A9Q1F186_SYNKA|nr:hypothetical protein SKAU_G00275910 [Synaphobranchus kaupii]